MCASVVVTCILAMFNKIFAYFHIFKATKTFAWAIISFVATVGGNLTITGSAGNT